MTLIIFLILAGALLTTAELFVPGGVLGLAAAGAFLGAIALTYVRFGLTAGNAALLVFMVLAAIAVPVWLRWLPHSRFARSMKLTAADDDNTAPTGTMPAVANLAVGDAGIALTDLRPAGAVGFAGRRVDVVSEGGLIPRDSRVRVLRVEGMRIVVRGENPAASGGLTPSAAGEEAAGAPDPVI